MAVKRVTIQDIADACGLSRNTVSKIFNDRGTVSEATRQMVLNKAKELGYLDVVVPAPALVNDDNKNIALLTQNKLLSHNFGAFFITSFTNHICRAGFTMKMYDLSSQEIVDNMLPPHLNLETVAGILCIELFDRSYLEMIASLGLPCTFVDGFAGAHKALLKSDFISMENYSASVALTERLIAGGARKVGFVGDRLHCNSFYERWKGFVDVIHDHGLSYDPRICILAEDGKNYGDTAWLSSQLRAMPSIPDAFVCANDFLAIHLMSALKQNGLRIPDDVMITGFDRSPEAQLAEPSLTTAKIYPDDIGRIAANTLIDRINHPEHLFRWISVTSTPVWGKSTK